MLSLLLLACSPTDPELVAQKSAVEAFERAKASLEKGDAAEAAEQFGRIADDRGGALAAGWRAKALADSGDLKGAIRLASEVLQKSPTFDALRINRALWRLRSGDARGVVELRALVADGKVDPETLRTDPDCAKHLETMEFVPSVELLSTPISAPETAFWGSEIELGLVLTGATKPMRLLEGGLSGPVEQVSVVESETNGKRTLSWRVRVVGAGAAVFGPLTVGSGAATSTLHEAVVVKALAPEDKATTPRVMPLLTPSMAVELAGERMASHRGWVFVRSAAAEQVRFTPVPERPPIRWEARDATGATTFRVHASPLPVDRVEVRGVDGVVFEGAP